MSSPENSTKNLLHPDEKITTGPGVKKLVNVTLILGFVVMAIAATLGLIEGDGFQRYLHSYVVALTYFTSMAIGALFFIIISFLIGAKWNVVMRRVAECITMAFPILYVLSAVIWLPVVLGSDSLYAWTNSDYVHQSHLVHNKIGYLNPIFFAVRINIYFIVWILVSRFFHSTSVRQDETGDVKLTAKMAKYSAPAMFAFAFTCAFFAFDLLMSIDPEWFSTMFGVVYFAGCCISIFSLMVLVPHWLQKSGRLTHSITKEHYHDIGKLLFAFVFFWGYVAFSQFMLIWGANIPEETGYFFKRWFERVDDNGIGIMGDWGVFTLVLIAFHLVVPFLLMMSRYGKRRIKILSVFAMYMLFWHYFDLYWHIMPALNNQEIVGVPTSPVLARAYIDVALVIGMGLLFTSFVARALTKVNLLPTKDPGLAQSLRFENQ